MLSSLYKIAFAALLGLTLVGCGGSTTAPPASAPQPVRSLHTGRTLLVGGNALVDYDPILHTVTPKYFGACVDNEGQLGGNSTTTAGTLHSSGVLNAYPSRVVIVADEFEITNASYGWAELGKSDAEIADIVRDVTQRALDNYYAAIVDGVVSGARTTIVGVLGQAEFNGQLRALALAYGAEYADTLSVSCP